LGPPTPSPQSNEIHSGPHPPLLEEGEGGSSGYRVADPDTVSRTLIIYKKSFMDDLVDSFTETWMEMEF